MANLIQADIQAELQRYIDENDLNKLFVGLVEELLLEKPSRPIRFIVDRLKKMYPQEFEAEREESSSEESDDDDEDIVDELPKPRGNRRRIAVSAESGVDPVKLKQKWEKERKVFKKSEAEQKKLHEILQKNLLFQNLDSEQTQIVIDAMYPVDKDDGEVIIQQGDPGDLFYVVEEGNPEVYVQKEGADPIKVLTYKQGDSFGELALMYNAPRAATVKAKGFCKLWALDRLTFKVILMDTTMKKRELHKHFLEKVRFF